MTHAPKRGLFRRRPKKNLSPDGLRIVDFGPETRDLLRLYDAYGSLSAMYRTQPAVRTVVDFLARNIAQLNIKTYDRVSATDRLEVPQHPVAKLLQRPNPDTTRYRMFHGTVSDLAIYDNAYWLKQRLNGTVRALVRVPSWAVQPVGGSFTAPAAYRIQGETQDRPRSEFVHFRGYNPDNPRVGLSALLSLRRILAEEQAAGLHREGFWRNAARRDGVISRPADAPEWSDEARVRFREDWHSLMSGASNAGKTAILEEGMTWTADSFSPRESEYIAGRKLTREEVARAYHIPLPMVGILDHATFSNIESQHRQLYQDTLGPWLAMLQEEIELQLLSEFGDSDVYVEFNMEEKLRGSFEEQATVYSTAVGGPVMTRAEARAKMNLPRLDDATTDELIVPLNVLIGGQASPQDSAPPPPKAVEAFLTFNERSLLSKAGAGRSFGDTWSDARWGNGLETALHADGLNGTAPGVAAYITQIAKADLAACWGDIDAMRDAFGRMRVTAVDVIALSR